MKRDIFQQLMAWSSNPKRKPLLLYGARQVGKTYALKTFAQQAYTDSVYLNFEDNPDLKEFFEHSLDPDNIIKLLNIRFDKQIQPDKTLIIFDEIQECPNALNSLKYFCESKDTYHIASAGSLLGVKIGNKKGFPVGKVDFIDVYPLSFMEFLEAIGKSQLRTFLQTLTKLEPIPI